MEGGGARAHSPELVIARVRSRVLAVVRGRSSHGAPFSFVGVPLRSWAVVSVRARSFPFVRVRFRLCAFLVVRARSFSFVGGRLRSSAFVSVWWCYVGELVEARGGSWCRRVVAGGVVVMGRRGHSFVAVRCRLSLWVV